MRVHLATVKQIPVEKLPPSYPALMEHLKRCCWQANVWYNAHKPMMVLKDPTSWGWTFKNERLIPVYYEGPTSLELLQKHICSCSTQKTSCSSESCTCFSMELKCSKLCSCDAECFSKPPSENEMNEEQ